MNRQPTILVVEDDPAVRQAVMRALTFEGYRVETAEDGGEALAAVDRRRPDAIVLDLLMPVVDGIEVCRRLRAHGDDTPILVITALTEVSDRVAGLDAGADDYLVKPFALDELLARVRALLRRASGEVTEVVEACGVVVDTARRRVTRDGREIRLTKTEFDLLELLVRNTGIVLRRDRIYEEIWGIDFPIASNPLEVYVGYLRRKLEADGGSRLIHTVRGVGYVLREEP